MSSKSYYALKQSIYEKYMRYVPTGESISPYALLFSDLFQFMKDHDKKSSDSVHKNQLRSLAMLWLLDPQANNIPIGSLSSFVNNSKYFGAFNRDWLSINQNDFVVTPASVVHNWYDCGKYGEKCDDGAAGSGHKLQGQTDELSKFLFNMQLELSKGIFGTPDSINAEIDHIARVRSASDIIIPNLPKSFDPYHYYHAATLGPQNPGFNRSEKIQYVADGMVKMTKISPEDPASHGVYSYIRDVMSGDKFGNRVMIGGNSNDVIYDTYDQCRRIHCELYHNHADLAAFSKICDDVVAAYSYINSPEKVKKLLYITQYVMENINDSYFSGAGYDETFNDFKIALSDKIKDTFTNNTEYMEMFDDEIRNNGDIVNQMFHKCVDQYSGSLYQIEFDFGIGRPVNIKYLPNGTNGIDIKLENTIAEYESSDFITHMKTINGNTYHIVSGMSFMQHGFRKFFEAVQIPNIHDKLHTIGFAIDFFVIKSGKEDSKLYGIVCK